MFPSVVETRIQTLVPRIFCSFVFLVAMCVLLKFFMCKSEQTVESKNVPKNLNHYISKSFKQKLTPSKKLTSRFYLKQQNTTSKNLKTLSELQIVTTLKIPHVSWRRKDTKRKRSGIVSFVEE